MHISVDTIKNLSLFSKLSDEVIAASLQIFKLVEPDEPNYRIFEEGDVGDSLYLILKGQVEIQKVIDSEAGTYKILAILTPGRFFGEMALLTGETRSAAAVLRGANGQLIKISRDDFIHFMSSTPKVASSILACLVNSLSDRLRASSNEVATLYETGRIIGTSKNYNEIVSEVLDRMIKVTKSTAGFVMMWNNIVECFECSIGLPEVPPITILHNNTALCRYWMNLDLPVTSNITDGFVDTEELGFKMPSVMYTPILAKKSKITDDENNNKEVIGVAVYVSTKPNAYSLDLINLSRSVTEQVSQAIINSRLIMENEAREQHELVYVTADL
jgi:CRP-like cAMP-binding protein